MDQQEAIRRFYAEVWPHAAVVLRTALFLTRDPTEADDLAQETMLKAFRSLGRFRAGTDAKAWLMTILRHARIDRLRATASDKESVSLDQLVSEPPAPPLDPSADGPWREPEAVFQEFSDRHVIRALQSLPEEIRWTLLLADVEGMDHADAAAVLDVPLGTVKSRSHRGRAMLRDALEPVAREMRLI